MASIDFDKLLKVAYLIGAAIAFFWAVFQYTNTQKMQNQTRRIEATKPFLDRQLKLYTDATQAAATLATSVKDTELVQARERFWSLYWGELALVEDKQVEGAMVQFGSALSKGLTGTQLQVLSLQLAHACRDSLADSWGVTQWRNPHRVSTVP